MMRRVGIKRSSSCDVSSWDPPPAKKARVEIGQRSGHKLWSKITSTFSGVLTFVRGWFHRPHSTPHTTPNCTQMNDEHAPSPLSSSPSHTLPHSSPPTVSEESSLPPTTCSVTSHPSRSTNHSHPSPPSTSSPSVVGSNQRQAAANKKAVLSEFQDKYSRSHLSWGWERPTPIPHPPTTHPPTTHPPPSLKPSLSTSVKSNGTRSLGPQHVLVGHPSTPSHHHRITHHTSPPQEKLSPDIRSTTALSQLPSQWTTPLPTHTLTTASPHSPPLSSPSTPAHPPSYTRPFSTTSSFTTYRKYEVLRQRQWVDAMRADHLHSMHQHKEAVERELQRLQKCRENRFQAEDSRVKRLQESVRNMSLIGEEEEEDEEEEELSLVLSEEQEQNVVRAVAMGPPAEVLSTRFNISITRADISRLTGLQWLNDEIINFYLSLVAERSQQEEGRCKVHTMSSFFYPKLKTDGYSGVRRWTRKVDIFAHDIVLYPIHLGAHWCLAAVDFRRRQFHYYDSLLCSNGSCLSQLREYLVAEARNKKGEELSLQGWTNVVAKDIPMQRNSSDCGVFTCMYARYLASDTPFTFSQDDMPDIRKHMICEILEQRLF